MGGGFFHDAGGDVFDVCEAEFARCLAVERAQAAACGEDDAEPRCGRDLQEFGADEEATETGCAFGGRDSIQQSPCANLEEGLKETGVGGFVDALCKGGEGGFEAVGVLEGFAQGGCVGEVGEEFAGHEGVEADHFSAGKANVFAVGAGHEEEDLGFRQERQFLREAEEFGFLAAHDVFLVADAGDEPDAEWGMAHERQGEGFAKEAAAVERLGEGSVGKFLPADAGGGHAGDEAVGGFRAVAGEEGGGVGGEALRIAFLAPGAGGGFCQVGGAFRSFDFVPDGSGAPVREAQPEVGGSPIAAQEEGGFLRCHGFVRYRMGGSASSKSLSQKEKLG